MLGIVASERNHEVVREFFELFKIPWEFARPGRRYAACLVADGEASPVGSAEVTLIYGSHECSWDREHDVALQEVPSPSSHETTGIVLQRGSRTMVVYCGCATFADGEAIGLTTSKNKRIAAIKVSEPDGNVIRIGYDLFDEVRFLLTQGQPVDHAAVPSLDHHITVLRDFLIAHDVAFVEIPPVPHGYDYTVCLTHDVDHPRLGFHHRDHTMIGFLWRALFGSMKRWMHGRLPLSGLWKNWLAAFSLPWVYLGRRRDPWQASLEGYGEMEAGFKSTFFVIPFKGRPGKDARGSVALRRASAYGVDDIKPDLERLIAAGNEVSLHGIDAWRDETAAREEREALAPYLQGDEIGVRMHWLYFDENAHAILDAAGFTYDSTVGYNETTGFRAGTFQAYRPLGATELLEIPLHAMDTALFYADYLDSSEAEAVERMEFLCGLARELGGVVTVNWHDRSLAPERQWGGCYQSLLNTWRTGGAKVWVTSMNDVARWFRARRSIAFESEQTAEDGTQTVRVRFQSPPSDDIPHHTCRVYRAADRAVGTPSRQDFPLDGDFDVVVQRAISGLAV